MKEELYLVKDACIIIDLSELDLLDACYSLNHRFFTTEYVVNEIVLEKQKEVVNNKINNNLLSIIKNLNINDIIALNSHKPGLSFADCSVLDIALKNKYCILTADASLRSLSTQLNIKCMGTLWILENLLTEGILDNQSFTQLLDTYMVTNKRAPLKHINQLKSKYNKK